MAAARALARKGHAVTLLEAFQQPRPLGSGLLLQPSGLAALRQLGLAERVIARGARVDRLDGRDLRGRLIMDMRYADWRPDAFGVGVHRATRELAQWGAVTRVRPDLLRRSARPTVRRAPSTSAGSTRPGGSTGSRRPARRRLPR